MDYEISNQEFATQWKQVVAEICVLDVREAWEVQLGTLAGSLHIPMGEVPARAHQELDPEAHIVVVCHHGVRSLSVVHWLREQGFERAQSLAGGLDAWSRQVDTTMTRY